MPVYILDRRRSIVVHTVVVQDAVVIVVVVLDVGGRKVGCRDLGHLICHIQAVVVAGSVVIADPVVHSTVPLQGHLVRLLRVVAFSSHSCRCSSPSQELIDCRPWMTRLAM